MKRQWLVLLLAAAVALGSCSGGGGGDDGDDDDDNLPVSINIGETSETLEVNQSWQFHYSVSNSSDTGVIWQVNDVTGGNPTVGTITADGLYTAPAAVPSPSTVTIKAIAHADQTKFDTATVTIIPASAFSISPPGGPVAAGATQQFTATTAATWEVSSPGGGDPGTIDASGLYQAPLQPPWQGVVIVKATSVTDGSKTATVTVNIVYSNATLEGRYVFRYRTVDKASEGTGGRLWAVGSFEADGHGAITNGTADFVSFTSDGNTALNAAFTGTYAVNGDGRATAQFVLALEGSPALPMKWIINSPASVRVAGFDDTGSGWGSIDRQDLSSIGTSLEGAFAFMADGLTSPERPICAAGMFDAGAGAITDGLIDLNDNGDLTDGAAFSGTCSAIDPATGRGTWQITADGNDYSFVFYAMGSGYFVWGSRAADQGYLGFGAPQEGAPYSNGSFQGDVIFVSTGYAPANPSEGLPAAAAGLLTLDGLGAITDGAVDSIAGGSGAVNATPSGTYAISANGHGTMSLVVAGGTNTLALYMYGANRGFYISMMTTSASAGQLTAQSSDTFSTYNTRGSWGLSLKGTFVEASNDLAGQMSLDGAGNITGTADANWAGALAPLAALTGTYTVAANGRGEITLNVGGASGTYALYLVSRGVFYLVPIGGVTQLGLAYRQY